MCVKALSLAARLDGRFALDSWPKFPAIFIMGLIRLPFTLIINITAINMCEITFPSLSKSALFPPWSLFVSPALSSISHIILVLLFFIFPTISTSTFVRLQHILINKKSRKTKEEEYCFCKWHLLANNDNVCVCAKIDITLSAKLENRGCQYSKKTDRFDWIE